MDYFLPVVLGTILVLLTLASPYLGLQIYLGFIYLRPADLYPALAPYHIARVFAIILLASFFIRSKSTRRIRQSVPPQTIMFLIWLVLILVSAMPGWWPYSLTIFYDLAKIFIAYFLIVQLADSESKLRGLIWTLVILNGILALHSSIQYFEQSGAARIGGFTGAYFGNAGDLAVMINLVVPIAFMLVWAEKRILPKLCAFFFLILFVGTIVATQSRAAGLVTLFVALCILTYYGLRSPRRNLKVGSVCLVVLLTIGVASIGSEAFKERMISILDYQNQVTAVERIQHWKTGMKMFFQNPILGIGAGMYIDRFREFGGRTTGWVTRPHNIYIAIAAELGIGGILCLLFLLFYTLKNNLFSYHYLSTRNPESWTSSVALGLLVSTIAFAVGGMFQTVLYYPPPYFIIGLSVALKRLVDREEVLRKERPIQEHPLHLRQKHLIYNLKLDHSVPLGQR